MVQIKFIPIFPKKAMGLLTTSREMNAAMNKETVEFERLFRQVSDGFADTEVSYDRSVSVISDDLTGKTSTDDEVMAHLNFGTDTRWAVMSNDWASKTSPGRLSSSSGQGHVVVRGRQAMQARGIRPKPGIKARAWDKAIAKQRRGPFKRNMQEAIKRGTS